MIRLRPLKEKDAPLMLEWMHDPDIQKCFQKNMMEMTLEDAKNFCKNAMKFSEPIHGRSIHWAIVDDTDEYLGTISLKQIDMQNMTAEYAISTRTKAHGKGIAKTATQILLEKAFKDYRFHKVYLNVLENNYAAINLYEKCGFTYEGFAREHVIVNREYKSLRWYGILEREFYL
jgi:RimJ/RimL family protein N-acetyltransferase